MKYLALMLFFIVMISGCSEQSISNLNKVGDDSNDRTATADGSNTLFRDGWNLDAALDSRPIGSLVVTIHTSNKYLAGTDCDIYFGMRLSDGRIIENKIDKEGYNDFEKNDLDDYFVYVGDQTFYPNQVTSIWLKSVKYGAGVDWHVDYIKVRINGTNVYSKTINSWINGGATYTMSPVNFPVAQDVPIPISY
jgi:hypothetical protein